MGVLVETSPVYWLCSYMTLSLHVCLCVQGSLLRTPVLLDEAGLLQYHVILTKYISSNSISKPGSLGD